MKGIKGYLNKLAIILTLITCGCSGHRVTDPKGYLKYVFDKKNGMVQSKTIDALRYETIYLTPEAMALLELKDSASASAYKNLLTQYEGMQYVKVSIKADKMSHIYNAISEQGQDPQELENYLNLDAQNDFSLLSGRDTLKCALYSFSKTYGLGKDWQVMLGFEKGKGKDDVYLRYDDKIGNNGNLYFKFGREDIKQLPTINFSL